MCRDVLKTPVFCVGGGKVSAVLARQDTPRPVKVQHENTFDWLKKMTKLVVLGYEHSGKREKTFNHEPSLEGILIPVTTPLMGTKKCRHHCLPAPSTCPPPYTS
jgi:hypothetical protein